MSGRDKDRARQKLVEQRAAQARRRRRQRLIVILAGVVIAGGAAAGIAVAVTGSPGSVSPGTLAPLSTLGTLGPAPSTGVTGPEGVGIPTAPVLAPPSARTAGQRIDGIGCLSSEQTLFHIHAHLSVIVTGSPRQVPAGIGIPNAQEQQGFVVSGSCFYWLHTHAADGIIHIESPVQRSYTLGEFFDEWGQPLGRDQVGPARGKVTATYNGQVYLGNPRDIPLTAHAQIQLQVGTPLLAPAQITFPNGL